MEALEEQLAAVNTLYNELRLKADADPAALEDAKKKLGELKKAVAVAKAKEAGASASKDDGKKKERMLLKTGKGTRDYGPAEMFCRLHIESIVRECFTTYGGSCLDTPVFERTDVLMDKYGEDAKLIFDLKDQGGEQLSLRYDHTVPLARYLAMNGGSVGQSKLWQIGKVYRRDNPVMSKGRMREFSQADFDISGVWDPMIPDAEIISLVCSILSKLDVGTFTIKLNHRKVLDGLFEVCGVPKEKIRAISSAVDKLDKSPWSEVRKEMIDEKGLDPAVADKIGEYVKHKGSLDLLEKLQQDATLTSNASAKAGLEEMALLFKLLDAYNVLDKISFDMSLARGLDYYTGIIYEAVVAASAPPNFAAANALASTSSAADTPKPSSKSKDKKKSTSADADEEVDENTVGVGSIAAGGRYDNLVGGLASSASGKKLSPNAPGNLPCVGVSIGMDRVFALMWPKWVERGGRVKETMAYVMAAGDGLLEERVRLVRELRDGGIKSDFLAKRKPKLPTQFAAGERDEVPFAIILGESELKEGLVTVKEQRWERREQADGTFVKEKVVVGGDDKGAKVKRSELIEWLKRTKTWVEWQEGKW